MNEEFQAIMDKAKSCQDIFSLHKDVWFPLALHFNQRIENTERSIEKIIENLGKLISTLENLHIVPKRGKNEVF